MIKSMTGYGRGEALLQGGKLTIEIRSLNGKNADINLKTSLIPKDKELDVRKRIADRLRRGTIDLFITWEPAAGETARPLNTDAVRTYYEQARALRSTLPGFTAPGDRENSELLAAILRMPEVVDAKKSDTVGEAEWPAVEQAIDDALSMLDAFRTTEGAVLYKDVTDKSQILEGININKK